MKILLLDLGKIIRGGQRQVFYLARQLAQTPGFEPLVAIPKRAPLRHQLDQANIPYVTLPSSSDLNPFNIFRLFSIISKHKPSIVHTNDAKGASLAAMAKKSLAVSNSFTADVSPTVLSLAGAKINIYSEMHLSP